MQQLAGKSIADVHHRGGAYAGLSELLDNVASCFGLELALQQILLACEVGLEIGHRGLAVGCRMLLLVFVEHLIIHGFLAFQELQPHVGGSQVSADANQVGVVCAVAIDDVLRLCFTDAGDGDGESGERCGGVATYNVHIPLLTGFAQSGIEFFEIFHREAFAEGDAHDDLAWHAIHGEDVAEVDHRRLVA